MAGQRGPNGSRYRAARQALLNPRQGTAVCYLCAHEGADQVDHVKPRSLHPEIDEADATNLRPVHGVNGCPTCGEKCNQVKGNGTLTKPVRSRSW